MSEHEKRLMDVLSKWRDQTPDDVQKAARALLVEQRAEVNVLKETIRAAHTEIAAMKAQLSGASEAIHSARAAALEEAATEMERIEEVRAAIRIRALTSAPVRVEPFAVEDSHKLGTNSDVLPTAKVREVLCEDPEYGQAPAYMSGDEASAWESGWAAANRHAAECLGLSLDAEGAGEWEHGMPPAPACAGCAGAHRDEDCPHRYEIGPRADGPEPVLPEAFDPMQQVHVPCGRTLAEHFADDDGHPVCPAEPAPERWRTWPTLYGDGTPCMFCVEGDPCSSHAGMPEFPRYDRFAFRTLWCPTEPREMATVETGLLPAPRKGTRSLNDGHSRDAEGCRPDCPGCAGEDTSGPGSTVTPMDETSESQSTQRWEG